MSTTRTRYSSFNIHPDPPPQTKVATLVHRSFKDLENNYATKPVCVINIWGFLGGFKNHFLCSLLGKAAQVDLFRNLSFLARSIPTAELMARVGIITK